MEHTFLLAQPSFLIAISAPAVTCFNPVSLRYMYRDGEKSSGALCRTIADAVGTESLAHLEYVSVVDVQTMQEVDNVERPAMVCLCVRMGKTRLIDNIVLG